MIIRGRLVRMVLVHVRQFAQWAVAQGAERCVQRRLARHHAQSIAQAAVRAHVVVS